MASRLGIETTFVDATDANEVEKAMRPNTKMVWVETPSNPTLKITDIRAVADVVKKFPGAILVVDNTFLSCYFQRPLELGADVTYYSMTKYMNGHTDVVMGACVVNDDKLAGEIRFLQNAIGPVPSPFDCYLVNRDDGRREGDLKSTFEANSQGHMLWTAELLHLFELCVRLN